MDTMKKGFSIIEILIVAAIIGILAAIAVPSYQWIIKDSKQTKKDIAIARVAEAKSQFYQDNRTTNAPALEQLLPYLNIKAGVGTNAFYNTPGSLFKGCFPKNEQWFLDPKGKDIQPAFEKLN